MNEYSTESEDDEESISHPNLIEPELLQLVHQHTRHSREMAVRRADVLESWRYNWQTKERKIPSAMVMAGKAIEQIEAAFEHLKQFHQALATVSPDLKPDELRGVDRLANETLRSYSGIIRDLEEKINALRLYWFPETVKQLKLGAYKAVRQPLEEWRGHHHVDAADQCLRCSMCFEAFDDNQVKPIIFKRRCTLNPLLSRTCDQPACQCAQPTNCLDCALDHLLKNGIHEGKSSVRCPACRGEVCIYDIQEITLVHESEEIRKLREQLQ
uniref:Uncharacterized protein n=1 Tax=viral metagenome TaxID=1070528 RepID=A0A6C0BMC8_9ZZZZ